MTSVLGHCSREAGRIQLNCRKVEVASLIMEGLAVVLEQANQTWKNRTQNSDSTAKSGISQNSHRRFHRGKSVTHTNPQIFADLDGFRWAWDL
jgi:hypothetical protein